METQLVRLDKPYNIICGKDGKFGLHIATMIVVKEVHCTDGDTGQPRAETYPVAHSYPVVGGGVGIDGEVWMDSELKDCLVICRQGRSAGLSTLKEVMKYCNKEEKPDALLRVPAKLNLALMEYNSHFSFELPKDEDQCAIRDYEVRLEFSEVNEGSSCMVYAAKESEFYFYDFFDNEAPFTPLVHTNTESIAYLAKLRDAYVWTLYLGGLQRIKFTTKDTNYQWFVDQLNSKKPDAAVL